MVKLEIAGVNDGADGCADGEPHGVWDAMAYVKELHGEGAHFDDVAGTNLVHLHILQAPVLSQLDAHEAIRQA